MIDFFENRDLVSHVFYLLHFYHVHHGEDFQGQWPPQMSAEYYTTECTGTWNIEISINYHGRFFYFSSHTEYVKRESIVIAWVKKKKNSLLLTNVHDLYVLKDKTSQKMSVRPSVRPPISLSVCMSVGLHVRPTVHLYVCPSSCLAVRMLVRLSVCPSVRPSVLLSFYLSVYLTVWMYVRTWTFHVDTITFEGVSGSKQNLVGVFHVWNVGLVFIGKIVFKFFNISYNLKHFLMSNNESLNTESLKKEEITIFFSPSQSLFRCY